MKFSSVRALLAALAETAVRLYLREAIQVSGWGEDHCEE
jgi:hypothetical protein